MSWRISAAIEDAPRRYAVQQWLDFAAVNAGATPTPRERAAASIIECHCGRLCLDARYRRLRVCGNTCAQAALHAAAKIAQRVTA